MKLKKQLLSIFEKANKETITEIMHRVEKLTAKGKDELTIENKKKTKKIFRLFIDKDNRMNRVAVAYFVWRGFDISVGMKRVVISWHLIDVNDQLDEEEDQEV